MRRPRWRGRACRRWRRPSPQSCRVRQRERQPHPHPAYDVCPQPSSVPQASQAMTIGRNGERSSQLSTCLATSEVYLLDTARAKAIIDAQDEVIRTQWRDALVVQQAGSSLGVVGILVPPAGRVRSGSQSVYRGKGRHSSGRPGASPRANSQNPGVSAKARGRFGALYYSLCQRSSCLTVFVSCGKPGARRRRSPGP